MLFEFLSIRNQYILIRMIWASSLNITDTKIFEDFKQLMFPSTLRKPHIHFIHI